MTAPAICEGPHCLHYTGRSVTDGMARYGSAEARCCNCGQHFEVPWKIARLPVPGHGPYHAVPQHVYAEKEAVPIGAGAVLRMPTTNASEYGPPANGH